MAKKQKEEKKEGENNEKENEYDERGVVLFDEKGQAKLKHGDKEILFERSIPFSLYPGEQLIGGMTPLKVVESNSALKLKANRDFVDRFSPKQNTKRKAGDEWLFEGPATYYPQVEVDIVSTIQAVIIKPNQALKLRAERTLVDRDGKQRNAGDRWLVRMEGAYLPQINEVVEGTESAIVLTEKKALHLKATQTFIDIYGVNRKAGEEWLVTNKEKEAHIPDVYEKMIREVSLTSLTHREWCIINDPVDQAGYPQLGSRKLVVGEANFFIKPGESLDDIGIRQIYVLGEEEALLVSCQEAFEDNLNGRKIKRVPGQKWYIYGPTEYTPPLQIKIERKQRAVLQIESLRIYWFFWEKIYF